MNGVEALWSIEFMSNHTRLGGYGVVVLETDRILGGDSSFVYIGEYEYDAKSGVMQAKVRCTNDRKSQISVIGLDDFELNLKGQLNDGNSRSFTLQGQVAKRPELDLQVRLTRRAELP